MLARPFSRRWLPATLLVLVAAAVLARLGIWQLDRLAQRRALNARVSEQQAAPVLTLDKNAGNLDLYSMEYRSVIVTGTYLPTDEVVLRNQTWETDFGPELGVKIFTPLLIEGSNVAILVDRGWIPQVDANPEERAKYAQAGTVTVRGQLRRTDLDFNLLRKPNPTLSAGQARLDAWNDLDLERLDAQMDSDLLPVYLQEFPQPEQTQPPYIVLPELDPTDEGPHFGYALQWFSFAVLLLIGYPFYIRRLETSKT